ncbi:FecR domain-containing protein [Pseudidiomarina sp. CB1]|uniref:FecR family protein n=1 Tax=Pseudidiomarina sp. CB1 TaxID=2972484 RepID=UPI002162AA55|nr:FecR domain-containing protein [Pseudidiomarina sp. CB1]
MSNATSPFEAVASYWVTRLYSGEMTAQEERELQRWRTADVRHEQAFEEALAVWDLSAQLYRSANENNAQTGAQEKTSERSTPKPLWTKLAIAASIAFIGVLTVVTFIPTVDKPQASQPRIVEAAPQPTAAEEPATPNSTAFRITNQAAQMPLEQTRLFNTKVGEVSHIRLDDGSQVSLNTDSAIRVTMRSDERHIELLNGEAFFDVAKDANRPFVVATEEQQITVLGTAFNVRQRSDEKVLKVAVIEGRVAVKRRAKATSPEPTAQANAVDPSGSDVAEQFLLAGDIGAFSDHSKVIQQQQFEQAQVSQTWRRGIVRFDDAPLKNVIKELNRYRQRKIALQGSSVEDLKISGVFHLKNGDAILNAIAATLPVQVLKEQEQIYITAR